MKLVIAGSMILAGLVAAGVVSNVQAQNSGSFSGTVERVWEDGFRLNIGDRTLRGDSWDVCGDFTANHVAMGDRLTVTGEFEGREFDAFSITNSDGVSLCQ
jgi:hypothetical protein